MAEMSMQQRQWDRVSKNFDELELHPLVMVAIGQVRGGECTCTHSDGCN